MVIERRATAERGRTIRRTVVHMRIRARKCHRIGGTHLGVRRPRAMPLTSPRPLGGVADRRHLGPFVSSKTIIDIARAAGVSFKTVSRVVNREPGVSDKTRKQVEAVIARLNYQPNVWARALRSSRSYLIGMFSHDVSRSYVNVVLVSAMMGCQSAGYHVVVEEVPESPRALGKRMRSIVESVQLDGAILVPPVSDSVVAMDVLAEAKIPFVRISPYAHLERGSGVRVDDRKAARAITEYLLGLGHRDIGFVCGPSSHAAAAERHRGFLDAMRAGGGNVRPEWIAKGGFTVESGVAAAEVLLSGSRLPTAVFAANDESALGFMSAAFRHGLVVPDDLSIVGFDDAPGAALAWPPLTTVHQPIDKMAGAATALLLAGIEHHEPRRTQMVDLNIVVRESARALTGFRAARGLSAARKARRP
jgi:LacI family transcriptional regulator